MNNETYGYIRVSSKDQNEDRQRIAMRDAGVEDMTIRLNPFASLSIGHQLFQLLHQPWRDSV